MSSSPESVTGYIVFGGFAGGVFAAVVKLANPELPLGIWILVAVIAQALGLILGYMLAWSVRSEQLKSAHLESQERIKESIAPQVVGKQCRDCNASIMFINDAHACPFCRHVVCVECEPDLPCSKCTGQYAVPDVVQNE